jgi:phage gpG-like protein
MLEAELDQAKMQLVIKRFKDMGEKAKNPRHAMDIIGAKAWRAVIENFDLEKNEDGSAWAKWKKGNQRVSYRPYGRGGTKLLRDTGYLRMSIRWIANTLEARIFTKVDYAKYHDHGKGTMHRSFMWINDKLRLQLMMDLLTYIKG